MCLHGRAEDDYNNRYTAPNKACRPVELMWERVAPSYTGVTQNSDWLELHISIIKAIWRVTVCVILWQIEFFGSFPKSMVFSQKPVFIFTNINFDLKLMLKCDLMKTMKMWFSDKSMQLFNKLQRVRHGTNLVILISQLKTVTLSRVTTFDAVEFKEVRESGLGVMWLNQGSHFN